MGFDRSKRISVGPLRFNLSKSGIGVSVGVTGLRFGVGPGGNYVGFQCRTGSISGHLARQRGDGRAGTPRSALLGESACVALSMAL